ncbi:MAG: histidinol-phosphate transaminase, partial [Candidatus Competibacterales bacterium]|nr:histidinol-phosphate transaminase [Candidatus Competibacterales bacterium]
MTCDFLELAAPGVRSLQPYQPGKPEDELRRELGLNEIVKLASNENPLGPSPQALAAIREATTDLARYPDGNGYALKRTLAEHHDVAPESITLGNGSNDILELIARTFLTPAHEAVFSAHAFAVYPLAVQAVGAQARVVPALGDDSAMPRGHDLDGFLDRIGPDTRICFIANPNNPTGTWLGPAALERFLEALPTRVLAVLDEAYFEYAEDDDYASALPWLERFPNLIVTRTFSKAYGLAGLRVGYGLSQPAVADLLNRVRQPFNVNTLAQQAALAALADRDHLARSRAVNRAGLAQLREACLARGLEVLPSAANFLCLGLGR